MVVKSQTNTGKNPKILIVDDDYAILAMYAMKLSKEHFVVEKARDGNEGLAKAEAFMPDLILLDLKMPNKDGEAMLRELRETAWGADIKVIVLTNLGKEEATKGLFLLGIKRYIIKAHYTPSQIVDMVKEVLA